MPGAESDGLSVRVQGAVYALQPLAEGPDLAAIVDAPAGRSLWQQAYERVSERVGDGVFALDEVRFDRDGRVQVLPSTSEPGVERHSLSEWTTQLGEEWGDAEPAVFLDWCATAPASLVEPAAHALAGAPVETVHPDDEGSGDEPPLKYRVAVIAGVTLLLGVASGWTMRPLPGGSVAVTLDETAEVVVDCGSGEVTWKGAGATPRLPATGRCRVEARLSTGTTLITHLDVASTGQYQCRPIEGDLTCFAL